MFEISHLLYDNQCFSIELAINILIIYFFINKFNKKSLDILSSPCTKGSLLPGFVQMTGQIAVHVFNLWVT